jgi:hypothetical protein
VITFSFIGNYGRLGNQMFQYAAIIGIAKKNGYDYCFPLKNTELPKWFNITAKDALYQCQQAHLETFAYEPAVFELPDNIDYSGYFQSEKYFQHCSNFIRNEYTFKDEIKQKVDQWFGDKEYISVHVRRGDYLTIQNIHPVQPIEWYQKAMEAFPNKKFLFFSDDLEWCRHAFPANEFSCFSNEGEDMYAMSKCSGHIITNSSFSWWAAWLSGKKTIAPKTWFGPEGPQDWQDIYCKDWNIL